MPIERIWLQEHDRREREKTIDEFAKKLKERLIAMQQAELQGEDLCHCSESGEDCRYMYQDVTCQYCAREQAIKDVDEIAEQLKEGGKYGK